VVCVEDEELQNHSSSAPGPFEALLKQQSHDQFKTAIAALPSEFREVILFRDVEGLTYQEISSILDIPKGTVMSRLSRARRMLAASMIKSSDSNTTNTTIESVGGLS
jgi:RNA polymerase sigma-70 factor (ECF subfamily)